MTATDPELLPVASRRETLRGIGHLLARHRLAATGAASALVLASAAGLLVPLAIGWLVDVVAGDRPRSMFVLAVGTLSGAALVQAFFTRTGGTLLARTTHPALADLREDVIGTVLRLPVTRVERAGSGDVISRVTTDIEHVADTIQHALEPFLLALLTIALTIGGLALLDVRFGLAALCAAPIQLHTLRWYLRRSSPVYSAHRRAEGMRTRQLLESTGGAATVAAFGLAERHTHAVRERSEAAVGYELAATGLLTRFFGRLNAAEFVGLGAMLVVGYVLVRQGSVTIGAAAAAALYFSRLFDPINAVLGLFDTVQQAGTSLTRLVGMGLAAPAGEPHDSARPSDLDVRVQHVDASYRHGHEVLHDVDLTVPSGGRVALVGTSGAGKTTLAKVIAGRHVPDRGEVGIGGVRLDRMDDRDLQDTVMLLNQETHVFAGPLAEDLRLAAPDATDDDLASALETVGATGWVTTLPAGIETYVGAGGHRLTPAQEQQVALARLVLRDPPVVVLDEATADAGSAAARQLDAAVARATAGRTSIVVTHRLGQAAGCDWIAVLEQGRIVEAGTHEDLLAAGRHYARLWQAWSHTLEPVRDVSR